MRRRRSAKLGVAITLIGFLCGSLAAEESGSSSTQTQPLPPVSNPAAERRVIDDIQAGESATTVKAATKLYKEGEYPLAAQRFDEALATDPDNEQALLFGGLSQLRLDNPEKAYDQLGRFQQQTKNEELRTDVGRARTILLREVSERAAKQAVANELALRKQPTSPQLVAVATFKNAGTPQFDALGKALAAMLIDNLSALPGVRVLERERVEALEQETKLEGTGLVEKGTAVRAGKLLRAGRVTAGSHSDWTASPTHLKLDALLVDVESGKTVAEGKSEALATEFYKLVPTVATTFATQLQIPIEQLPPETKQKLVEEHTHDLNTVINFGKLLDALDHHDVKEAAESCKLMENADPNFKLMKKKCAFIPLEWASVSGLASSLEPVALAAYATPTVTNYTVPIVLGALAVGGIAGGVVAATSGGGGGGGSNGGAKGNNPPQLNGVGDRTVQTGQTAAIDMNCKDPDGTLTSIASGALPPGGSFQQSPGNPSTGSYKQTTNGNQAGQTFGVSFTCVDSGTPPLSTSRGATIRIVAGPVPTAAPAATPTQKPVQQCVPVPTPCTRGQTNCCSGNCNVNTEFDPETFFCCSPLGNSCNEASDCCQGRGLSGFVDCGSDSRCCLGIGSDCNVGNDRCCPGSRCQADGNLCQGT
jgi:hypothetical protein